MKNSALFEIEKLKEELSVVDAKLKLKK